MHAAAGRCHHSDRSCPPPLCCVPLMLCVQGEARLLREEVHRVPVELRERQLALTKLRSKHESLMLKGRGQEGEWAGGG